MAEFWGGEVSRHAIERGLKKLGYTRKKTCGYRKRDEKARAEFEEDLGQYRLEQRVYVDESGTLQNRDAPVASPAMSS